MVDTVLIEQSSLFRVGLEYLLNETQFRVVARLEVAAFESLPGFANDAAPLVILGSSNGLESVMNFARKLKARHPKARLACIRKTYDATGMTDLLSSGVDGLLLRDINVKTLVQSLELIMAGESIFPQNLLTFRAPAIQNDRTRIGPAEPATVSGPEVLGGTESILSARERDVLRLLVIGDSNKVIALKLAITEATVKVHVKGLLRKIQAQNRTQAAIWALQHLPDGK